MSDPIDMLYELAAENLRKISHEDYYPLKLHTPYRSRWRVLWHYIRCLKREGTILIDVPEVGELPIPTDLVSYVSSMVHKYIGDKIVDVLSNVSVLGSLICAVYLLYFGARVGNAVDNVFTVTNFAFALYNTYANFGRRVDYTLEVFLSKAISIWNHLITNPSKRPDTECSTEEAWPAPEEEVWEDAQANWTGIPEKWYFHIPKFVVLASSLACVGFGYRPKPTLDLVASSLTTGRMVSDTITSLLLDVFGVDISGASELQALATELEKEGLELLSLTPQKLISKCLPKAKIWIEKVQHFLRAVRSTNFNTAALVAQLAKVTAEVTDAEQLNKNIQKRPVPAAIYFWGERGHGKTEFVTKWLIPALNKTYDLTGTRASYYDLNIGKHASTMAGEAWAFLDEYSSLKDNAMPDGFHVTLNAIISGAKCTLAGAALNTKQQTAAFNGVFICSNNPIEAAATQFKPDSKKGFVSRFRELEVVDPSYDATRARSGQLNRQRDFSHLEFRIKSDLLMDPTYKPVYQAGTQVITHNILNSYQVLELVKMEIENHEGNHKNLSQADLSKVTPSNVTLWDVVDAPQAGSNPTVFWISGAPGIGKTERIVKIIRDTCHLFGAQPLMVAPTSDIVTADDAPTQVYIMDDTLHADSRQHQEDYSDFYNKCRTQDLIFIISNFGPIPSWTGWVDPYGLLPCSTKVKPLKELYPGFMRRSGTGKRFHFEATPAKLFQNGVGIIDIKDLASEIQQAYFKSEVRVVNTPNPPTTANWDISLVFNTNVPSISEFQKVLRVSMQHPRLCLTIASILSNGEGESAEHQAKRVLQYILRNCPKMKIRVATPDQTYVYMDGTFYTTRVLSAGVDRMEDDGFTLDVAGVKVECSPELFYRVMSGEVNQNDSARECLLLTRVRDTDPYTWDLLVRRYRLPFWSRMKVVSDYITGKASDMWKLILNNLWLAAILLLILAVAFWVMRGSRTSERECVCKTEKWDDDCPFDQPQAKGKSKGGKGRRSKFLHFRAVNFNGRIIYEDQVDDCQEVARVYHELKRQAYLGNRICKVQTGAFEYDCYYDNDAHQWVASQLDMPHSNLFEDPIYQKIKANTVPMVTEAQINAFFLTPTIAILPRHWTFCPGPWSLPLPGWELIPVYEDASREVLACAPHYRGKVKPYPAIKDLTRYLLSVDQIRNVSSCIMTTWRNGTMSLLCQDYKLRDVPITFNNPTLMTWTVNAGYASFGEYADFTRPGDCGAPVMTSINGQRYIIGIHAAASARLSKFVSVVLCQELYEDILSNMKEVDKPQSTTLTDTYNNIISQQYQFPEEFANKLQTKSTGISYHPQGAVKVIGYIKNGKPMDAKAKAKYRGDFPQTVEGWKVKVPALTEREIQVHHRDKVPTDAFGLAHVHLIRTQRLEKNTYSHGLKDRLHSMARNLGEYWKLRTGKFQLNPLSISDALNGNYQVLPVDLNTSAGVAMRMLTGASMKRELVTSVDGKHVLIPAAQELTEQQYEKAKEHIRLSIPGDACLKSELLLEEKQWKKRVYYNVPLPTVLNLKRLFGPIQHALSSEGPSGRFIFSLYPLQDWHELITDLMIHGSLFVCLDVSGYDHSVNGAVITALADFYLPFYETPSQKRPSLEARLRTLLEEVAFMPMIFERVVVSKEGGVPSGIFGTSLIDATAWELMLAVSWEVITGETVQTYMENVCAKIVGDDLILTVSAKYREVFHGLSIAEVMRELFEMKVTPAMGKDGEPAKYLPLEEASFCSNFCTTLAPCHPSAYIPRLKEESLMGMLTYSDAHDLDEIYQQYKSARYLIWPYGEEKYNLFERELQQFARRHEIEHYPMTFRQAAEEIWQILRSPDQSSLRTFQKEVLVQNRTTKMSSTNMSRQYRNQLNQWVISTDSQHEFQLKYESTPAFIFFQELHKMGGIDWTALGSLAKPGTSMNYTTLMHNTAGVCVTSTGILAPPLQIAVEEWLSSAPVEGVSDREMRFNRERLAHLAIAKMFGYNVPEFPEDTEEQTWAAFKYLIAAPPPRQARAPRPAELLLSPAELKTTSECPQASRGLPEMSTMGEGGPMMRGGNMSSQVDPLAAPAMTITPAVATSSQEIADSDMAVIPTVLESIGGLEPASLVNVNYANNIVSLCGKQIYTRRYNITSNTAAATIIDEIAFNPWDANLVSAPIAQWGSLHEVFNGSIDIVLNSYSAATIVGSVIISYVPPLLQKKFQPTLQNLKTLSSAVLNLKVGGSVKITITGGNLKDCAVSRSEIEEGNSCYGKLYVAAYTDIVNSYGVDVSIPIVRTTALGKNAYFSHPSYLTARTSGAVTNPGPTPPSSNYLILDSNILYEPLDTMTTRYAYYQPQADGTGAVKAIAAWAVSAVGSVEVNTEAGTAAVVGAWWGANKEGSTFESILSSVTHVSSVKIASQGVTCKTLIADQIVDGVKQYETHDTPRITFQGLNGLHTGTLFTYIEAGQYTGNLYASRVDVAHTSGSAAVTSTMHLPDEDAKMGELDSQGNELWTFSFVDQYGNAVEKTNVEGAIGERSFHLFPGTGRVLYQGAPVATNGLVVSQAPVGYVAVYLADQPLFIPAVLPTVSSKRTVAWPRHHNLYMRTVLSWFKTYTDVGSFSYDLTLISGAKVCTLLVNRKGCFIYDPENSRQNYSLNSSASSLLAVNYQPYATDFPNIAQYQSGQFISRVQSTAASFAIKPVGGPIQYHFAKDDKHPELRLEQLRQRTNNLYERLSQLADQVDEHLGDPKKEPTETPQMMAFAAVQGGSALLGGMGSWMSMNKKFNHELEMQTNSLNAYKEMGALQSQTTKDVAGLKAQSQKEASMARMGYMADASMLGEGNNMDRAIQPSVDASTSMSGPQGQDTAAWYHEDRAGPSGFGVEPDLFSPEAAMRSGNVFPTDIGTQVSHRDLYAPRDTSPTTADVGTNTGITFTPGGTLPIHTGAPTKPSYHAVPPPSSSVMGNRSKPPTVSSSPRAPPVKPAGPSVPNLPAGSYAGAP